MLWPLDDARAQQQPRHRGCQSDWLLWAVECADRLVGWRHLSEQIWITPRPSSLLPDGVHAAGRTRWWPPRPRTTCRCAITEFQTGRNSNRRARSWELCNRRVAWVEEARQRWKGGYDIVVRSSLGTRRVTKFVVWMVWWCSSLNVDKT